MKAAGLIIALGILVTGADMACSRTQMTPSIERNDYGKGKKVEELDVQIGNKKKKVRTSVEVSERQYSAKEVQELFSRIIRKMDRLILAGNETLDRVDEDLDLVTDIPGEPVKVSWELDRYDVMDIQGKLKEQNISEKGVLVKLNAVLTYTANEKEQDSYQCVACVYPKKLSGEESTKKDVEEEIKKLFPAIKTLRMDRDTTMRKDAGARILKQFAEGKADMLIGTQMIVKGHDYSNVTLVGVILADLSLYANDYRAGERTFDLLTQAAGRAGRG